MPREQHLGLYWSWQPEGLEAFQLELGADQENFSVKWEAAAIAEVFARHKATPPVAPPLVLLLSVARRLPPAQYGQHTANKCPFLPSYTVVIPFLLTHFMVLTSNLSAAATPDLIPPLSLSGLTGLPFPSSVSAATALPWLTTPNSDKGHVKIHV